MRNLLTLVALLLSTTGIVVSLAREELRCRLGLSSAECVATEQQGNPPNGSDLEGDRQVKAPPQQPNVPQPDPKSPIPSTAKLMETMDHLRQSVTPQADPEAPGEATESKASPAQTDSTSQDPPSAPDVPVTSKENAVDTAILGEPAPSTPLADTAPIAPPAAKNPSNPNAIPVIPAQGTAIPVTPPAQE